MARTKKKEIDLEKLMPAGVKPPSAVETEMSVLGAMLIESTAVPKAVEVITSEAFYLAAHRHIFSAMLNLFKANEPIDTVTVYQELKKMGKLDDTGGAAYLSRLTQEISSAANIEFHAKIIAEKSIQRRLITISHEIAASAYREDADAYDLLDEGEQKIFQLAEQFLSKSYVDMGSAVKKAMEYIQELHDPKQRKFAVGTGFYDMDDMLGGFQKSDLIILAARPSMGKTALALSFARNAAILHNVPVAIFSLEMATIQLVMRLICAEGRLNAHQVRTGKFPEEEGYKISKSAGKLSKAPIYIDDAPGQTVLEIRAKTRRLKAEKNIGLVMIDYLQLMQGPANAESREREISQISRSLKSLAKELEIPVIALAQLNRAVEARTDKRPLLSDLRESGSLEQDADVVLFINRPEYYDREKPIMVNGVESNPEGMAEIIVAKHRNGPTGDVWLRFIKDYARFESLDQFRSVEGQAPKQLEESPEEEAPL